MLLVHDGYEIDDDPPQVGHRLHSRLPHERRVLVAGHPARRAGGSHRRLAELRALPPPGDQVGFARVISDKATFGWLADVYVLPEHRGHRLGHLLVETVLGRPQ